jgi:hypothetical protein
MFIGPPDFLTGVNPQLQLPGAVELFEISQRPGIDKWVGSRTAT